MGHEAFTILEPLCLVHGGSSAGEVIVENIHVQDTQGAMKVLANIASKPHGAVMLINRLCCVLSQFIDWKIDVEHRSAAHNVTEVLDSICFEIFISWVVDERYTLGNVHRDKLFVKRLRCRPACGDASCSCRSMTTRRYEEALRRK